MLIDLVIPTFNREQLLKEALHSVILAIENSHLDITIVVVDNNSIDGTKKMVEEFINEYSDIKLQYIFEPNQGVAFARNRGLSVAQGDIIVYMDDEQEIDYQYFNNLFVAFKEIGADCIGGKIIYKTEVNLPRWIMPLIAEIGCLDLGDKILELNGIRPLLKEGNIAFKTKTLLAVGGFNTSLGRKESDLLAGEGDELQSRMAKQSYRIAYCPALVQYNKLLPNKLRKGYWRHHAVGSGKTSYLINREGWREANRWFGVPRFLYLELLSDVLNYIKSFVNMNSVKIFHSELDIWRTVGVMLESRGHCND